MTYKSNEYVPEEYALLETKDAMKFLSIGRTALETLVAKGAIKPIRYNAKLIRWRLKDLKRIATEGAFTPEAAKGNQ